MTDSSPPPAAEAASPRRWRWLLLASLAVNLVFVGGLAAVWFHGPPGHWRSGASQTAFGLMRFSRELPPERRDAVRAHLREARPVLRDLKTGLREARLNAAKVLASPSYTPEAMKAAMDAIAQGDSRMREAGTAALLKAIEELSPQERQKLAEHWMRRLERERVGKRKREEEESTRDSGGGP